MYEYYTVSSSGVLVYVYAKKKTEDPGYKESCKNFAANTEGDCDLGGSYLIKMTGEIPS